MKLPPTGGSGGGAVDSFNGRTGVVVSATNDYGASQIANTPAGNITATNVQAAIDELDAKKIGTNFGSSNIVLGTDNSGDIVALPNYSINTATSTIHESSTQQPSNVGGSTVDRQIVSFEPTVNSPNDNWNISYRQVNMDNASSGFDQGTNGTAVQVLSNNIVHNGSGDVGDLQLITNNFQLGNGTDPIDVRGVGYAMGFGAINAGVNISGAIQGYGFQPSANVSTTFGPSSYISPFYDYANFPVAVNSYTSFASSPIIGSINNNNGFTGVSVNPNITTFSGNAGFTGLAVSGNIGTFANGSYTGVNINPTIADTKFASGLTINMNSVTLYAGVKASAVIQDLTFEADVAGTEWNAVTVEYTTGGTAGSEVVTLLGYAITVQIEDGVSTATQVKAALDANFNIASAIDVTISGTASNPQVAVAPTSLTGGINPGSKRAMDIIGDVSINGALSFTGALSIGQLNAFYSTAIIDGGGVPTTVHGLISAPTVAANATIANADTIGVNTASLMSFGANSTVTTNLIGIAALGLPAVVTTNTGCSVDLVTGATFAVSLDAGSTGGTLSQVSLCRATAIPNGITTVTELVGYEFTLPFGDPGTTTWGVHIQDAAQNYFEGAVVVGATDLPSNSSVGIEITGVAKAFLNARMTTTERNALTAVNGLQIYNTTTDKLQVYAAGSWVDLH